MTGSSWAGIIGAVAGVITAVSLVITAVSVLLPQLKHIRKTADETHKIVNQQRTDGLNFQRALIRALEDNGVAVPIDQSIGIQPHVKQQENP